MSYFTIMRNRPQSVQYFRNAGRVTSFATTFAVGWDNFAFVGIVDGKLNRPIYKMSCKIADVRKYFRTLRSYDTSQIEAIAYWTTAEDYEGYEHAILIKTHLRGVNLQDEYEAYEHGCHCSYDCCAHWFGGIWSHKTKHLGGDYYIIYFHSAMNV